MPSKTNKDVETKLTAKFDFENEPIIDEQPV